MFHRARVLEAPRLAAVFADAQAPVFLGGILQIVAAMWADVSLLEAALRGDGGIDWGAHDPRLYEGVDRLRAGGRVADVGTGYGTSAIVMAEAFPQATVIGYDLHPESIEEARRRAKEAGLQDRPRLRSPLVSISPSRTLTWCASSMRCTTWVTRWRSRPVLAEPWPKAGR